MPFKLYTFAAFMGLQKRRHWLLPHLSGGLAHDRCSNPPFIGNKRMRDALGDGYTEALRAAYPRIPQSADFVMFWWEKAALATRAWRPATDKATAKGTRRFGLITTNSLTMIFNRKVLESHLADPKAPLSLTFAIPDHPWVDAGEGAAVRIAMTVAERGKSNGRLQVVIEEAKGQTDAEGQAVRFDIQRGKIFADLRIGADIPGCALLKSNAQLGFMGVIPHGEGMVISAEVAMRLTQHGSLPARLLRPYSNGKQLISGRMDRIVIDAFPMSEGELRTTAPAVYQWLLDTVKPLRDANRDKDLREKWWLHRRSNQDLRTAQVGISRFIATIETSKHRTFSFLPGELLPDQKLRVVMSDDAWILSVLSGRVHVLWADVSGGRLGFGNDPVYNHSKCFDPFPFPTPSDTQKTHLRSLGEQLDAHRKAQQAAHPKLTLTAMYNVLEKRRAGDRIEGKDKEIYDQGLIGILLDLHNQIDAAVADAYGWPTTLTDDEILHRLVDLNRERELEESQGLIRWLRPDYQNPAGHAALAKAEQSNMDLGATIVATKAAWPKTLPEQMAAVQKALAILGVATPEQVARQFTRARASSVRPMLDSLTALGQAHIIEGGRFAV